jgi:thioredoxin 2
MSEAVQIVCGHCESVVRVPADRIKAGPHCPKCHFPLFEGKPVTLTAANFDKHVTRSDLPVVVDFWAPWCGPCLSMAPAFETVAREMEGRKRLAKLNTEDEPAPAARFNIRSIPTLIVFHHGREIVRQSGAMNAAMLTRWIESAG